MMPSSCHPPISISVASSPVSSTDLSFPAILLRLFSLLPFPLFLYLYVSLVFFFYWFHPAATLQSFPFCFLSFFLSSCSSFVSAWFSKISFPAFCVIPFSLFHSTFCSPVFLLPFVSSLVHQISLLISFWTISVSSSFPCHPYSSLVVSTFPLFLISPPALASVVPAGICILRSV